jgi:ribonuclease HIII
VLLQAKNEDCRIIKTIEHLVSLKIKIAEDIKAGAKRQLATYETNESFIGCDEVGVGDYFGGIAACACHVPAENIKKLIELGVCDSKKLTDEKIDKISDEIAKYVQYQIIYVPPAAYNDFNLVLKNTHAIKAFAHNRCLMTVRDNIAEKGYKADKLKVVMDQFAEEKKYYEYVDKVANHVKGTVKQKVDIFETKAESKYIAVAAASIVARSFFLIQIKELEKKYDIKIPLGSSSSAVIETAIKIATKHGKNSLKDVCKYDFAQTKKVLAALPVRKPKPKTSDSATTKDKKTPTKK